MANEYRCTGCGATPGRGKLVAKKVLFTGMGAGAKTLRARVIAHLCVTCTKADPIYNMDSYVPVSEKVREVMPDATA